ncbi:diguanylate cyclase [Candidimonas sp. SYP-B2681]|uniref:diguanylate cyclase n=1 Tax=Candidimonas sp. SYP-B2681 TaxID=2497686 RepID=UPI000F868BD2|nr:diguanylate cyclase [Candidimonas sp. SYP-B2681]RTZ47834.1 diguanylate cyclase [Candidimonas sp. SYP-B2681]
MTILETIQAHSTAMRLPLYAVTLSAVPKTDTPLILMLHWHGFARESTLKLQDIDLPKRPVAGSALQIDTDWKSIENLDEAMLEAAWRLGAWDLERVNCRPWWRLSAPLQETVDCHSAFGDYLGAAARYILVQAPDQAVLLELAASRGYVRWMFRPRSAGIWQQVPADDKTLGQNGERDSSCPVAPIPYDRDRAGRDVYRLGRSSGLSI